MLDPLLMLLKSLVLLELAGGVVEAADGDSRSAGAAGIAGDTSLDCATDESVGDAVASSSSILQAS